MTAFKPRRFIVGILSVAALFASPSIAAAQSKTSTFTITFDRTGTPRTETAQVIDPVTGQPVVDPVTGLVLTTTRPAGAFVNPCTAENVDVLGSTNVSVTASTNLKGVLKVAVGESTKGTGSGWTGTSSLDAVFSGNTYTFNDSQQFTTNTVAGQLQSSDFTDKFTMRGRGALDNWIIRVTMTLTIDALGNATVTIKSMTADPTCKG
jgi:hypothetical protein